MPQRTVIAKMYPPSHPPTQEELADYSGWPFLHEQLLGRQPKVMTDIH